MYIDTEEKRNKSASKPLKGTEMMDYIDTDHGRETINDPDEIAPSEHDMLNEHALTKFGAALTIISTIVGGGIVGLPFAFYWTGILCGAFLVILLAF